MACSLITRAFSELEAMSATVALISSVAAATLPKLVEACSMLAATEVVLALDSSAATATILAFSAMDLTSVAVLPDTFVNSVEEEARVSTPSVMSTNKRRKLVVIFCMARAKSPASSLRSLNSLGTSWVRSPLLILFSKPTAPWMGLAMLRVMSTPNAAASKTAAMEAAIKMLLTRPTASWEFFSYFCSCSCRHFKKSSTAVLIALR